MQQAAEREKETGASSEASRTIMAASCSHGAAGACSLHLCANERPARLSVINSEPGTFSTSARHDSQRPGGTNQAAQ